MSVIMSRRGFLSAVAMCTASTVVLGPFQGDVFYEKGIPCNLCGKTAFRLSSGAKIRVMRKGVAICGGCPESRGHVVFSNWHIECDDALHIGPTARVLSWV